MKRKTHSPLKDKPLRLPGQSLSEERQRLWEDKIETWLLLTMILVAIAVLEWWRHLQQMPPSPILFTVAATVPGAIGLWRYLTLRPKLRQLRQGIDGERAVGQFLERLREQGYQVFHDVTGSRFNVDHVCIGPGGVFTIETKTWSKPDGRDVRIAYDGESLRVGGAAPQRDPLTQALAQAHWLVGLLESSSGRRAPVQPVVVFPGWFVDATPGANRQVWVLEPKALPAFLANEPLRLSPEDVKLLSFHLSRYIRTSQFNA